MGPLYHLIAEADRKLALQQAFDRLQPGGVIFSAWISRLGILGDLLKKNPGWIENQAEVQALLAKGHRPDDAPRAGFRGYLAQVAEIAPLHEAIGFETIAVPGIEPAISADDASYNIRSPDGRGASACTIWFDPVNAVGLFEPVATHPDFQGKGLGKAVMAEGLRCMKVAGML